MGTRNLTCVYLNGETRVAQYCQFDGYPSGQGKTVLDFLHDHSNDHEKFKEALLNCNHVDSDYLEKIWCECGKPAGDEYVSFSVESIFERKYPQLCRIFGAKVLSHIFESGGCDLSLYEEFSGDSLFCEYAYVIDYDTNEFEVYRGFQKSPNNDRFAKFNQNNNYSEKYYPIAKIYSWPLDSLPTLEEFYSVFGEGEA